MASDRSFEMMATISSGLTGASGRRKTEFQTLKMDVFAPMPSASVSTATAVKPGFFSDWRMANFKSFMVRGQSSVVSCLIPHSTLRIPHLNQGSGK